MPDINGADGVAEIPRGASLQALLQLAYPVDGGGRPSLIDLRDADAFMTSRLHGSYNVPLDFLVARMFLLPDRVTPLGLVVAGPPETQKVLGAAGGAKEEFQVAAFLVSRGWQVAFCVEASAELWRVAASTGVLEVGGDALAVKRRWPFQPSKLLMQQASQVEEMLARSRLAVTAGVDHGAVDAGAAAVGHDTAHVGSPRLAGLKLSAGSSASSMTLRMLDVGCGSGRDLAWLSTRNSCVVVPRGDGEPSVLHVAWECVGLDSWHGALQRAAEVLTLGDVPAGSGGVTLQLVQIGPGTGSLKALPLPPAGGKAHQRQLLLRYMGPAAHQHQQAAAAGCVEAGGGSSSAVGVAAVGGATESTAVDAGPKEEEVPQATVEVSALGCFDLLVCVRFLERSFLETMAALLKPGGVILFSTFVDGPGLRSFGRPQGREHVLQPGELAESFFGPDQGFEVLRDDIEAIPDGREVTMFCSRKVAAS